MFAPPVPLQGGREQWDCKTELQGHTEAPHRRFTHWEVTGKGEEAVCVLSELW